MHRITRWVYAAGAAVAMIGVLGAGTVAASTDTPATSLPALPGAVAAADADLTEADLAAVPTVPPATAPPATAPPATAAAAPTTIAAPATAAPATAAPATAAPATAPPATAAVADAAPAPAPAANEGDGGAGAAPAAATIEQLQAAVGQIFGPTDDLVGQLSPWVATPADVPTPPGAELIDFSLNIDVDGDSASYYASVDFTSTATPAEMVTFFESSLVAVGYTKVSDGTQTQQGSNQRDMAFETADPALGYGGLSVQILDSDVDYGRLTWSYDTGADSLAPFSGWFADVPLPADSVLTGASLSSFTGYGGRTVSVSVTLLYPGVDADTQMAAVLGALPAGDFALGPDDDPDDEFFDILSPRFPDGISVYLRDWDFPEGSTRLSVDTSFELAIS